jgi:molybdate transport repressor ModE-like protein
MSKRTAGIILATGYGSTGNIIDPMTRLGSTSIVRRQVFSMQLAHISPIIVISGWDALRVEHHLDDCGIIFFQMEDFTKGNLYVDVLPAINYLMDKCDQFVYSTVEYPLLYTENLKKLMDEEGAVRYPVYKDMRGWPLIIDMEVMRNAPIEKLTQFRILQDFLETLEVDIKYIKIDSESILCSINDQHKCNAMLNYYNSQMLRPTVHIDINYDAKVFDLRLKMLLLMIDETKSVKNACARISMSIGKAWDYINHLEHALGYPVVTRKQGGRSGGKTELTLEGTMYLQKYMELEQKVNEYTNVEFARIFGGIIQ